MTEKTEIDEKELTELADRLENPIITKPIEEIAEIAEKILR
jgi:hypothetical protein